MPAAPAWKIAATLAAPMSDWISSTSSSAPSKNRDIGSGWLRAFHSGALVVGLAPWGRLDASEHARVQARALEDVVRPVAAALLQRQS